MAASGAEKDLRIKATRGDCRGRFLGKLSGTHHLLWVAGVATRKSRDTANECLSTAERLWPRRQPEPKRPVPDGATPANTGVSRAVEAAPLPGLYARHWLYAKCAAGFGRQSQQKSQIPQVIPRREMFDLSPSNPHLSFGHPLPQGRGPTLRVLRDCLLPLGRRWPPGAARQKIGAG